MHTLRVDSSDREALAGRLADTAERLRRTLAETSRQHGPRSVYARRLRKAVREVDKVCESLDRLDRYG